MTQLRGGGRSIGFLYNLDLIKACLMMLNNDSDGYGSFPTVWSCCACSLVTVREWGDRACRCLPALLPWYAMLPFTQSLYMVHCVFSCSVLFVLCKLHWTYCYNYNKSVIFITWFSFSNPYSCVRVNILIYFLLNLEVLIILNFQIK